MQWSGLNTVRLTVDLNDEQDITDDGIQTLNQLLPGAFDKIASSTTGNVSMVQQAQEIAVIVGTQQVGLDIGSKGLTQISQFQRLIGYLQQSRGVARFEMVLHGHLHSTSGKRRLSDTVATAVVGNPWGPSMVFAPSFFGNSKTDHFYYPCTRTWMTMVPTRTLFDESGSDQRKNWA